MPLFNACGGASKPKATYEKSDGTKTLVEALTVDASGSTPKYTYNGDTLYINSATVITNYELLLDDIEHNFTMT